MFALSQRTLVLVAAGETQKEILGFSQSGTFLWERGHERRLYGRRLTDHDRVWGETEDAETFARRNGLEFRGTEGFRGDLAVMLKEIDEIQTPFADAAFVAELVQSLVGEKRFRRGGVALKDLRHRFGEMKLKKSSAEVDRARLAARKSAEAHRALLKESWVGRREKDLALRFDLELRRRGIDRVAYESIVGSGERAMTLHARASERVIGENELILVDAAGMWGDLCADITRTFPSGAKFTAAQRKLYDIVLKAQLGAVAMAKPGVTLDALHDRAKDLLKEGLVREKWMAADRDDLLELWFPHKTSHWLGKQVHDRAPYFENDGSAVKLEEGMIFTIEPGLYMRGDEAPAEIRGAGIRIEDDVLVTRDGVEVLSASAPKGADEIESLRAAAIFDTSLVLE